jgi:hypothetical protein
LISDGLKIPGNLYLPLELSIAAAGLLLGGILDIVLSRRYVIGGKIVAKTFNLGTLSWFEGIRFNVSVDVGASTSTHLNLWI